MNLYGQFHTWLLVKDCHNANLKESQIQIPQPSSVLIFGVSLWMQMET